MRVDYFFLYKHMCRSTVTLEDLQINTKEDLYQTVLIPEGQDYHGRTEYSHHTVWAVIDDINVFQEVLDWLTNEEILSFKDEDDGNILSGVAESGKGIEYFELFSNRIGHEATINLLLTFNRCGTCPLAEMRNYEAFVIVMNYLDIDARVLRRICLRSPDRIVDHLACMINSAPSSEIAELYNNSDEEYY